MLGMAQSSSNKKIANGLVAAGAAAVLAVYSAGYARTRSAADKLDAQSAERRPGGQEGRGPAPSHDDLTAGSPAGNPSATLASSSAHSTVQSHEERASDSRSAANIPAANQAPSKQTAPPTSEQTKADATPVTPTPQATIPAPVTPAPAAPPVQMTMAVTPSPVVTPPAPVAPPPQPTAPAAPKYKDGTYTGWGTSRHGAIQAEVIIEGGRIISANISQCLTRYSCSVIGRLPPEVPQRQSAEVDYVSGATQSTNAYYYAVTEALGKAK